MATTEISFARSDARVTMPGVPMDPSAVAAPYTALAKGASAIGGQFADLAKATMKRDASAITADALTSVHEETNKEYLEAQRWVTTNVNDPENEGGFSNIDAIVRFPSESTFAPEKNGKPFSQFVLSNYDERVKDRLSKVKNPIARADLQEKFGTLRTQLSAQSLDFEARATMDARKTLIGQSADRMGRLVLDNPSFFDQQVQILGQTIDAAGLGAAAVEQKDKMSNQLATAAAKGWIEIDPIKAKEMLSSEATGFRKYLSPDQVSALKNQAETAFGQKMAEVRQTLSMQESSHRESILETGEGIPGYEAELKRAYADRPEILAAKIGEFQIYRSSYVHKTAMDGMPLSKLQEYAQGTRPPAGDPQFAPKTGVSDFLQRYASEQIKLAQEDPGALVEQLNARRFERAGTPRQKAALRLALEQQKGVPVSQRRMLTNAERDGIVQTIQGADAGSVLAVVQEFTNQYDAGGPNEMGLSDRFYRELTAKKDGLSPTYSVLLQNVRDGAAVSHDLVRSLALSPELKKFRQGEKEQKNLMEKVDSKMRRWSEGFTFGQAENLAQVNEMRQVVGDLAKLYMLDQGMGEDSAVEKATRKLITEKLAKSSGTLQIPNVLYMDGRRVPADVRTIEMSLKETKEAMVKDRKGIDVVRTFGGVPEYADEKFKNDIINTAIRRGYWKTNEDYTGAYFMVPLINGDLPMLGANGERFVMPFSVAQDRVGKRKYSPDMFVEPTG